ncbi:putative lipoprotein [Hyphomonas neptunium ATCC 15444]|uniref:Putative lipoprotein n=2 Tax=Hyphomonas TaxID=85 RepID=Q0BWR0_HYPNA|nr:MULTISPECIES: hypothetical protein [Hyphomonas]ABI76015.1 putative lipoprotein [Hyphomonas neptunium ATCC 15444]KCZ91918.1 putative lipoprotein [Hyphomonas hirschiana VP5]
MSLLRLQIASLLLAASVVLAGCDQIRLPGASGQQDAEPKLVEDPLVPGTDQTGEPSEVELPVRPESVAGDSAVDWEAARRDLAARPIEDREGSFQIASGEAAPPVPVFLPSAPVSVQGGESDVRFQPVSDGYYAFFPGEAYDTIVNGTNKVIAAPGEATQPRSEALTFQPTTTGAQVSFSRYGADYLVEFECKALTNGLPTCITQEEAEAFATDLVISGTR